MKSDNVALDIGNTQEMFSNCWKGASVLEGWVCSKNMHSRMHDTVCGTRLQLQITGKKLWQGGRQKSCESIRIYLLECDFWWLFAQPWMRCHTHLPLHLLVSNITKSKVTGSRQPLCPGCQSRALCCSPVALTSHELSHGQPGFCNCIPRGISNSPRVERTTRCSQSLLPLHCNYWLMTSVYWLPMSHLQVWCLAKKKLFPRTLSSLISNSRIGILLLDMITQGLNWDGNEAPTSGRTRIACGR